MQLTGSKDHIITDYKLYHRDVYVPKMLLDNRELIVKSIMRHGLVYSQHASDRIAEKGLYQLSDSQLEHSTIIEYKCNSWGKLVEVLISVPIDDIRQCYVVTWDGIVKTAYARHAEDMGLKDIQRYEKGGE